MNTASSNARSRLTWPRPANDLGSRSCPIFHSQAVCSAASTDAESPLLRAVASPPLAKPQARSNIRSSRPSQHSPHDVEFRFLMSQSPPLQPSPPLVL